MNGGGEDQNKLILKFHVTVVESLIETTGPCATRAAHSNPGQVKGGAELASTTKPQGVAALHHTCIYLQLYLYLYLLLHL